MVTPEMCTTVCVSLLGCVSFQVDTDVSERHTALSSALIFVCGVSLISNAPKYDLYAIKHIIRRVYHKL